MRNLLLLLSVVIAAAFGCGSGQTKSQQTASATAPPTQHAGSQMCPMMATGANVVASDTSDGVAIAFTTSGDVAALRTHVRRMAEMHNGMMDMHHNGGMGSGEMHGMGSGEMHGGMGSGEMHGGMMHTQMVPSRASVEDIPGGARVMLVPTDPSQVAALRGQAREHAAMMARGECPMMEKHPQPNDEHSQHHPAGG